MKKFVASIVLLAAMFFCFSPAAFAFDRGDVTSHGGLVPGSRIIRVTTLADDGEGSLRKALEAKGPRVVVFDVSGLIRLKADLDITNNQITIAGETAPTTGVVIYGGTLRIHASDVTLSNIAIYPGAALNNPKVAEKRDGISVYGSVSKRHVLHGIILQNVSVGWAVDENIGLQGLADGVRIERCLITHALRHGGHPKGVHSMNLLIAPYINRVVIAGSVFAASEQRSPRIATGTKVSMLNNLIYATGAAATHLDTSSVISGEGAVDIIGNAYVAAPFSNCKRAAIAIDRKFLTASPSTKVFLRDNLVDNDMRRNCFSVPSDREGLQTAPQMSVPSWTMMKASDVKAGVLPFAGSHPSARNAIDAKTVKEIKVGTIRLLENEDEIGGVPDIAETERRVELPTGRNLGSAADVSRMKTWLCDQYKSITGLASCPYQR